MEHFSTAPGSASQPPSKAVPASEVAGLGDFEGEGDAALLAF
jgi:hypothetical protein